MNFKTFLVSEVLDKPYKWRETASGEYTFYTDDGSMVHVTIFDYFDETINDYYAAINFERDWEIDLTNQGDAFRILATVQDIVKNNKKFLQEQAYVAFSAKSSEKGRVKLYRTFAKKLSKFLGFPYIQETKMGNQISFTVSKEKV